MSNPSAHTALRRPPRSSDIALHLDMAVIGDVCTGISLSGYRLMLGRFLRDESGNQAALLAALGRGASTELPPLAHVLKGASASLGLRGVQAQAARIEARGAGFTPADCAEAAAALRNVLDTAHRLLGHMGFI